MKASNTFSSDYDAFVSSPKRKKLLDKAYEELCLSEIVMALMEQKSVSVRALAKEIGVSPTVIQDVRSKRHSNLTLRNFLGLTSALGAKIKLEIGGRLITLKE